MKGTEKQIKWAQDIVAKTKGDIDRNIADFEKRAAEYPDLFGIEAEEWKNCKVWFENQMAEAEKRDMPASWYIDNRDRLSGTAMNQRVEKAVRMRAKMARDAQ